MFRLLCLSLLTCLLVVAIRPPAHSYTHVHAHAAEASLSPTRRVNVPYDVPTNQSAIFWFGQVNETSNHANVRIGYTDDEIVIFVHIFDRRLWYDPAPAAAELSNWDAVSLYLNLGGNADGSPAEDTYRLLAQFSAPTHSRSNHQIAYRGTGSGWAVAPLAFTTEAGYRGSGFNNGANARGWWVKFAIPFDSLSLNERPAYGSTWGLSVTVHDRDDAAGTPIPDQIWPETATDLIPATWGQLGFGLPGYVPPPAKPVNTVTIRHGLNGNSVVDAHVGGHSICGSDVPSWSAWGQANYAGYHQVNVQNQWDVADWPCYSKYYVTFPLEDVPAGRVILSAKLTMFQFGNAGQGQEPEPEPSFIQAFTVAEAWDEAQLTWNNAPLAVENLGGIWVDPLLPSRKWPGVAREWNVTGAVAEAYAAGEPLRLALYSADTAYHSGRYFHSSDAGEAARPFLQITWGEPFTPNRWAYVPLIQFQ